MPSEKATTATPSGPQKLTCDCGRYFKSKGALKQHRKDSPVHRELREQPTAIRCSCGKLVQNEHGLKQHLLTSQTHRTLEPSAARGEELGLEGAPDYGNDIYHSLDPDALLPRQGPSSFVWGQCYAGPVIQGQAAGTKTKKKGKTRNSGSKPTSSCEVWSSSGQWYSEVGDNHGLCDKDCGWCGHCADEVDFD